MAATDRGSGRDLPERYGPWQTDYERFARWEPDGTGAKPQPVQVRDDAVGRGSGPSPSTPRSTGPSARRWLPKGGVDRDEREDPSRAQTRQALSRSLAGHLTAAGSDHPWTNVRFTAFWISRNPLEPVLVVPTRRGNQRRRGTGPHRVAPPAASRTAPPGRHRSRCPAVRRDAVAAQGAECTAPAMPHGWFSHR